MPGLADPVAQAILNDVGGSANWFVTAGSGASRFMALYTAAPLNGAGTGGTEVAGNAYARAQIAGQLTAGAAFTTASTTITLSATAPGWILAQGATAGLGFSVWDNAAGGLIGTIQSIGGTTLTLQAPALRNSQGAADALQVSAFPPAPASTGTEPTAVAATVTNTGQINFPQSTGSWGSVLAWATFDAPTAGNMRYWDYLGNFPWTPGNCNVVGTPANVISPRHGLVAGQPIAVTNKMGGNFPTFSQSNFTNNVGTLLNVGVNADNFTTTNAGTAVGVSATGDIMFRQLVVQAIPANTTPQFAAGAVVIGGC